MELHERSWSSTSACGVARVLVECSSNFLTFGRVWGHVGGCGDMSHGWWQGVGACGRGLDMS